MYWTSLAGLLDVRHPQLPEQMPANQHWLAPEPKLSSKIRAWDRPLLWFHLRSATPGRLFPQGDGSSCGEANPTTKLCTAQVPVAREKDCESQRSFTCPA